jgi:hypothetical protein
MLKPVPVGDRDLERKRATALGFDVGLDLIRKVLSRIIVECDIRSFSREDPANGSSDAARTAGNESALSLKQ